MPDTTIERVRVRMFRQGLGDCHLISFFTRDNTPFHMLIDCGTLGATTTGVKIADVVAHIARETGEHLHLLIATHEHHDHLSGFNSARAAFDRFQVDQVWVAWTEDPADPLAQDLAEHADDLLNTLRLAADALDANSARLRTERKALRELGAEIRDLLSFSGELPADDAPLAADFSKTVNEAIDFIGNKGMLMACLPMPRSNRIVENFSRSRDLRRKSSNTCCPPLSARMRDAIRLRKLCPVLLVDAKLAVGAKVR